jgi:hypothetical protein
MWIPSIPDLLKSAHEMAEQDFPWEEQDKFGSRKSREGTNWEMRCKTKDLPCTNHWNQSKGFACSRLLWTDECLYRVAYDYQFCKKFPLTQKVGVLSDYYGQMSAYTESLMILILLIRKWYLVDQNC